MIAKKDNRLLLIASFILIVLLCLLIQQVSLVAMSVIEINDNAETITLDDALRYLDNAEESHQQVLDHPELIVHADTAIVGDLAFHAECVRHYQEIKKYLVRELNDR